MSHDRRSIDLNSDLGEGYPHDEELLRLVTSASIACGAHAGDPRLMSQTIELAKRHGVTVGAHPGFPDREGFGRRECQMSLEDVEQLVIDQCETLKQVAAKVGYAVRFVKPHGALYNQAQWDESVALGIVKAATRLDLPLLGQPGSVLESIAAQFGLAYVREGFPDRRYTKDGRLVPRSEANATLETQLEVAKHLERFLVGGFDTLCIHGDAAKAVENARWIRATLTQRGLPLRSFIRDGD